MAIELVRENIECEQLLGESSADTVVKAEYLIPDTHPDVDEILMLDAKPLVTTKEVMQDKIYIEGQIEYTLLYLAKEEEKCGVHNVTYIGKFSNTIDMNGTALKMPCEAECFVEHIEPVVINERKISIEGILNLKASVYKNYNFEIIKDVVGSGDMQFLKNPTYVDKVAGSVEGDLVASANLQIPMDKPQIGKVLKCDVNLHKKDTKVMEGKVQVGAFAHVQLLYRGKDTRDICFVEDDIFVNKDMELGNVNSSMDSYTDFRVENMSFDIKEDDLGENRIVDVEAIIKSNTRVMYKEQMETIEDAYSPSMMLDMEKKNYELNVMHGQANCETIVKGNIEPDSELPKPSSVVMSTGKACITEKKIVEDKILIEGLLKVDVLYNTEDEEKNLCTITEEIPFNCAVEIPGSKIDMGCIAKVSLESVEASVEANTIAIKGIVEVYGRVNYGTHKEFLVDMIPVEGEKPSKKASITIYVVQKGDNLWKIAKKYHTTMDTILKVNELENSDAIRMGQKLIIPGRAII